jgi:phosphatidate cytidylyltransferase
MGNLVSRLLIAALALPVVLALVLAGGWWLVALALVIAVLALHEFTSMIRQLRPVVLACYLGAALMLLGAAEGGMAWLVGGFLATLLLAFVLHGVASTRQPPTVAIGSTVLGAAWIGFGLAHFILLRDVPRHGQLVILTVLLAVFAADTLAYAAGRLLGRHRMAPVISPGKTWEGFVAGAAAALAVAFFALYEDRNTFLSIWESLVLGGVLAVSSVLGDLFESALKRDMQVKDSGRLLGGHGGMLDRLDSHLFAAPAAFYVLLAFGAV